MATFPKLFELLNPWSSKRVLFMSAGESPSSGSEKLSTWKESLNLQVEQADIRQEDETSLKEEVKNWKSSATENQEQFEANIKYKIERAEAKKQAEGKYGDVAVEVLSDNQPVVFLKNTENKHLSNAVANAELIQDASFTVDYGISDPNVNQTQAKMSERYVGLHHIFAKTPEVNKIQVTPKGSSESVTLVRCADGKYRKEGQSTGRHHPIYQGYTVKILEVSGRSAEQKTQPQLAEVKREEEALAQATEALTTAQKQEAESARAETQAELENDRKEALVMAGVLSGEAPAPAPSQTPLSPEEETAFNTETTKLKGDISSVIKEVFKSDAKESAMITACENVLNDKKFVSITFKDHQLNQGKPQEITLTVIDKKGVQHVYSGVSNQPIGENAFIKEMIPAIVKGESVKNYYWNREAFKDLFKKMSVDAEGSTPRPELGSPYESGVIYGTVRKATTTGEESGAIESSRTESIGPLKHGEGAYLPNAMRDWTIRDFERNKHTVDHMDQFMDALKGLAGQSGKTEMALLQPFLDGDKITYQEICRQVYGRTPNGVWERYEEARTAKQEALTKSYEDFFTNSYRLLEATRLLEKNNAKLEQIDSSADTSDEKQAKALIAGIFNPEDSAPIAKRSLGEVLSYDKSEFEMSMDQTHRSYLMRGENIYETGISSSGAYAQLVGEFIKNGEVNYEGLAVRFNRMKQTGYEFFTKMNESDRRKLTRNYGEISESNSKKITTAESLKTGDNPLSKEEILLIQLGILAENKSIEVDQSTLLERQREREILQTSESVQKATTEQIQAMLENAKLSPEDIQIVEAEILKRVHVGMNEKGQFGLVLHDLGGRSGNEDLGAGYAQKLVDVPLGEKGHFTMSVGVGAAFIEDMQVTFYPSAGGSLQASTKFGEQDQNTASIGAGISVGPGHVGGGVMASLKFKAKNKAEGTAEERARVWYFRVGAGIAGGIGLNEGGASVRILELEVGRDLDAAAQRKYLKLKERMGDKFDEELNAYVQAHLELYASDIKEQTSGMSEAEAQNYIKAFQKGIAQLYIMERGKDAINEMCGIQFGKVGVGIGVGALGGIVPYFGIAIKGRKTIHYVKTGPDMDVVMEASVREQLATQNPDATLGRPIYLGGDLTINENGERTIENSIDRFEQDLSLEGINARLKAQGMELVPLPSDSSKVQLRVRDADGFVNIYIDPTSKIQAFADGGKAILNLDWEDAFSILRVDHYKPFKEGGGGVKNVDIFISDNPEKTPLDIKNRTGERLTWRQTDIYPDGSKKNTLGDVIHVDRNTTMEGTASFQSESALTEAGYELGNLTDEAGRKALETRIQALLGQIPEGQDARIDALDKVVSDLIKKGGLAYETLTSDPKAMKAIIDGVNATMAPKLNAAERTYLLQSLLVESRAKLSGNPDALKKHILGWNTKALEAFCTSHGIDSAIATTIMNKYGTTLDGLGGKDVPNTPMGQGYAFNTLIGQGELGTLGRGINSQWETSIAGMQEVTESNLIGNMFNLNQAQAKAFIDAQLREYRYNGVENPTPLQRLRSPLGMQLLDKNQVQVLFGEEKATALISAMESGNIDTNAVYWTAFNEALTKLENGEAYRSETGRMVIAERHMVMGFLESCRNFTVATKERLKTFDTGTVNGIETHENVNGVQGTNFTDASVAVMVEETPPGKIPPPPKETPEPEPAPNDDGSGFEDRPGKEGGLVAGPGSTSSSEGEHPNI